MPRVSDPTSPMEALQPVASQEIEVARNLRHVEVYTTRGLLTLLCLTAVIHVPSQQAMR